MRFSTCTLHPATPTIEYVVLSCKSSRFGVLGSGAWISTFPIHALVRFSSVWPLSFEKPPSIVSDGSLYIPVVLTCSARPRSFPLDGSPVCPSHTSGLALAAAVGATRSNRPLLAYTYSPFPFLPSLALNLSLLLTSRIPRVRPYKRTPFISCLNPAIGKAPIY